MKQENVSLWNVNKEYQNKGLVYTFAREFRFVFVEEPEGYSVDAVKKIAEIEGVSECSVKDSLRLAKKKIKKF